jgi:hypothetical protein
MRRFTAGLHVIAAALVLAAAAQAATPTYRFHNVQIVGGGFVTGLVAHPMIPELFFARTDIGGAYRWDSFKQRWTPLLDWVTADNLNIEGTISIALDPVNPFNLYLAQGEYVESFAGNGALYISHDLGKTFTVVNLPFQLGANEIGRSSGERLGVVPWSPTTLYLGTNVNGLWQSLDSGSTWAQVTSFPVTGAVDNNKAGVSFVMFGPKLKGAKYPTIYVGVSDTVTGLYQSVDNGATWQAVPGQPTGDMPLSAALSHNGNLYVAYSNQPAPYGAGNGQVWKYNVSSSLWTSITPPDAVSSPQYYGYDKVVVDPWHPDTVMVSTLDRYYPGDEIYRSKDAGATWVAMGNEPYGPPVHSSFDASISPWITTGATLPPDNMGNWIGAMLVDPWNPDHLMYGTGGTIWETHHVSGVDSGGMIPWKIGALGIEETALNILLSPPSGAHLLSAMADVGAFRHDDLNVSPPQGQFHVPQLGSTTGLDFAQQNAQLIARVGNLPYAQTLCGGYSTDQGNTWTTFTNVPGCANGPGTIAIAANGASFVWAPSGGATAYSTDRGTTWIPSAGAPSGGVIASDRVNPLKFYTFDQSAGIFYVSTDGGKTFTPTMTGLTTYSFKQISVNPNIEGDVWLSLQWGGLWHSTDSGATFTSVSSVVWSDSIGFGAAAPASTYSSAIYFVGRLTWSGAGFPTSLYRSDDGAQTWNPVLDTQHQYGAVITVSGDPRIYGRVYIGTEGRGIVYGDLLLTDDE